MICIACGSRAQGLSTYQEVEEGPDRRFALEGVELVVDSDQDYDSTHVS